MASLRLTQAPLWKQSAPVAVASSRAALLGCGIRQGPGFQPGLCHLHSDYHLIPD